MFFKSYNRRGELRKANSLGNDELYINDKSKTQLLWTE